ncbi:MAG: transglycosylase domain-containing protein, partial [bacterium]
MKIFYSFVIATSVFLLFSYIGFYILISDLPFVPADLRQLVYAKPTEIYADDGSLAYRLGGQTYAPLEKISPFFAQAVIATEDGDFYKHHGINKKSYLRAMYQTLTRGRRLGGVSTLTQQLAKIMFFSYRREVLRKLKDMLLAMQLETMFSKDEILEAYCNLVYFGGTAYGVEDAAQQFFNKSAIDLELSEAALLAGILNSPYSLNPFSHPEAAKHRQTVVLSSMLREGYIDQVMYDEAATDSMHYVQRRARSNDFIDYVISQAEKKYGSEAVRYGGLKIYTTFDPDLQKIAEEELATGLTQLESALDSTGQKLQGAVAVISVPTGEVKALVGSRNHVPGSFNRAVSNNRHVGSGIKPFVYFAALEQLGLQPFSVEKDSSITYRLPTGQRYTPGNFEHTYRGPVTLKFAIMNSINTVAVQLGNRLTPEQMAETIRRFGVNSKLDEVLSLALGTSGIAPVEMASAYAIFARSGVYYEPAFFKRVEDINGTVIDRGPLQIGQERIDPQISYQVLDMLRGVVDRGTAYRAIRERGGLTIPIAGKTGTSYDYTDAWFNGVTTSLATSVWVGYDRDLQ